MDTPQIIFADTPCLFANARIRVTRFCHNRSSTYVYAYIFPQGAKNRMNIARRAPLKKGRRISLTVNLTPENHRELSKMCNGNRSAAIEMLITLYRAERVAKVAEPALS